LPAATFRAFLATSRGRSCPREQPSQVPCRATDYRGGPVIDCGCGAGTVARVLCGFGVRRVVGIDLDRSCLAQARRAGVDVVQGDLSRGIPLRGLAADIAMVSHVLEHLDNGVPFLASVCSLLRPGGAVVILTPDWTQQGLTHFYNDPTHRRPYTRVSLEKVIRAAGLLPRVLLNHNVGYRLGRTPLWRIFPRLCFTGDSFFAIAERPSSPGAQRRDR